MATSKSTDTKASTAKAVAPAPEDKSTDTKALLVSGGEEGGENSPSTPGYYTQYCIAFCLAKSGGQVSYDTPPSEPEALANALAFYDVARPAIRTKKDFTKELNKLLIES